MEAIIRIHRVALKWPAHHRKTIERVLRRIVSPMPTHFLNVLFLRLDELFLVRDRAAVALIDALTWVEDRSSFESLCTEQLLKGCIEGDLELDRLFIARYRDVASPEKTEAFRSILKDHDEGMAIVEQFRPSPSLGITVTSSAFWRPVFQSLLIPDAITTVLSSFAEVYRRRIPRRRLWWDPTLSSVVLQYSGGCLRCDGITATLLLTVSQPVMRYAFDDIASKLGLKISVIEAVVRVLKSSKAGQLITVSESSLILNDSVFLPSLIVIPPSTERTQPIRLSNPEIVAFDSQASQIDASILRTVKPGYVIGFPQLLASCASLLGSNVTEDVVRGRLKELEARHFVEQDPSGGYRYKT
jgi:hypothetical protein